MTDTTTPAPVAAAGGPSEGQPKAKRPAVPANPALVEFPRDEYGTMSALRKELLLAASTVRGNETKHKLFLETLSIAAQHAQSRLQADKNALQQEYDDEVARIERVNRTGRVHARTV